MITREAYQLLGGGNKAAARALLRPFTAHNEKLGINLDYGTAQPVLKSTENSAKHPATSTYKDFV